MKKLIYFALLALLLSACLPQNVQIPQSPLLSTLERKSGLIAYIGVDGNVYVSDQAGRKLKKLTNDAVSSNSSQSGEFHFYELPTWASDGKQVAFIGTQGTTDKPSSDLYVANAGSGKVNKIYSSPTELPFYVYWSPDNANVSFLSSSGTSQSLLLQSVPTNGGKSTIIDTGSPYYWSWAPDGHTLISHSGGATNSTTPEHLAFIQIQGSNITEDGIDTVPAAFQAPAWSPDGSHIALTRLQDNKKEIILTDSGGKYEKTLGTFNLNTGLGWSSDSKKLAFIDGTQSMTAGVLGTLNVVDIDTAKKISVGEAVVAFFWSPNGKKVAYFVPLIANNNSSNSNSSGSGSGSSSTSGQQLLLQLNMLDIDSGKSDQLFTYQPTNQFLNMIPYFDQYGQSSTIWSPDNNNLVLSFLDNQGAPSIAIVAASGKLQPRLLAQGYLAFWSWK